MALSCAVTGNLFGNGFFRVPPPTGEVITKGNQGKQGRALVPPGQSTRMNGPAW